tara:strand:+ start:128 stop:475 length:348 start_codon:yes stop_codon:yes gene_type:complete
MKDIDSLLSQGWYVSILEENRRMEEEKRLVEEERLRSRALIPVGELLETWSDNNFIARTSRRVEALADEARQLQWAVFVKGCRSEWQRRAEAVFAVGQMALRLRRKQRYFGEVDI